MTLRSRGHGCKLARKCNEAVLALMECRSIKEAAKRVGISPDALYTWLKIPEFQEMVDAARQQVFDYTITRLQAVAPEAVNVLDKSARGKKVKDEIKVRAADLLLSHLLKAKEFLDLKDRLEAVEAELESREQKATSKSPSKNGNGRGVPR